MTIMLQDGEKLEMSHKVKCNPYGSGVLYVTNRALIVEIKKQGIILHRWHGEICGVFAKGRQTIIVKWPEKRTVQSLEFRIWGADKIVREIVKKHNYAGNFTLEGVSHVMYTDAQREEISEQRVQWGEKQLQRAEKKLQKLTNGGWFSRKPKQSQESISKQTSVAMVAENNKEEEKFYDDIVESLKFFEKEETEVELAKRNIQMWKQFLKDIPQVPACRSLHVPQKNTNDSSLEDYLCWNDAWYDKTNKRWCSLTGSWFFNPTKEQTFVGAVPEGTKYDEKTGVWSFPEEVVRMFQGLPYVITTYDDTKEEVMDAKQETNDNNTTLPEVSFKSFIASNGRDEKPSRTLPITLHTLLPEMLTDAILYKRWRPVRRNMTVFPMTPTDRIKHSSLWPMLMFGEPVGEPMVKYPDNTWRSKVYALWSFKRGGITIANCDVIKKEFGITEKPTAEQVLETLGEDLEKWGE